jgi:beta-galactosidase
MAIRYGQNSNVIGWQIDNEPGAVPDYSPASQREFRTWLKRKYKTIGDAEYGLGRSILEPVV